MCSRGCAVSFPDVLSRPKQKTLCPGVTICEHLYPAGTVCGAGGEAGWLKRKGPWEGG